MLLFSMVVLGAYGPNTSGGCRDVCRIYKEITFWAWPCPCACIIFQRQLVVPFVRRIEYLAAFKSESFPWPCCHCSYSWLSLHHPHGLVDTAPIHDSPLAFTRDPLCFSPFYFSQAKCLLTSPKCPIQLVVYLATSAQTRLSLYSEYASILTRECSYVHNSKSGTV